jgi:hypothetical protein
MNKLHPIEEWSIVVAVIVICTFVTMAKCQDTPIPQAGCCFPDAPSTTAATADHNDRNPAELKLSQSPPLPQHWWQRRYEPQSIPWPQVFRDPLLYTNLGIDAGLSFTDTHYSEQAYNRGCVETSPPLRPSYGSLHRDNWIEAGAVGVVTAISLRVKMPRWIMPLYLIAPGIVHGRGIADGIGCR